MIHINMVKWKKTFSVPNNVEADKISAKIDNGVLKVLLSKSKIITRKKNCYKIILPHLKKRGAFRPFFFNI